MIPVAAKTAMVIDSCETLEQLEVAKKYLILAAEYISYESGLYLYSMFKSIERKIKENNDGNSATIPIQ